MSLKSFHIAFITLCSLLAIVVATWSFTMVEGPMGIVWSIVALAVGVVLVIYARKFKQKMQDAIYR